MDPENLKKRSESGKNFDPNQVRLNPGIMENLDNAHSVIDKIIKSTQYTLERNQLFLKEFEQRYE